MVWETLCSRLETTGQLPHGLARPPLDDWLVVIMQGGVSLSAGQWLRRCEPRRSQRVMRRRTDLIVTYPAVDA